MHGQESVETHDAFDSRGHRNGKAEQHCGHSRKHRRHAFDIGVGRQQRCEEDQRQQDEVPRTGTLRPVGDKPENSGHGDVRVWERRVSPEADTDEEEPCRAQRHGGHGQRPRPECGGRDRRSGAPHQDRLGFVARQVIHLPDERDGSAERRRRDHPDGLGDGAVICKLQHRAADISRENDAEQRADPAQARDRFPVRRHEDQDCRPEQQRGHHGKDRPEAQRPAVMRLDIRDDRIRRPAVDEAQSHPSGGIRSHA